MRKLTNIEKLEKIEELKGILKNCKKDNNGYKLTFKIESVAKSGMSRCFSIYAVKKNCIINITYLLCEILDEIYTKEGFIRVFGCGSDMLFETCYNLNREIKKLQNYRGTKKTSYNYLVSIYYDLI